MQVFEKQSESVAQVPFPMPHLKVLSEDWVEQFELKQFVLFVHGSP
jgi:hypothetical protein